MPTPKLEATRRHTIEDYDLDIDKDFDRAVAKMLRVNPPKDGERVYVTNAATTVHIKGNAKQFGAVVGLGVLKTGGHGSKILGGIYRTADSSEFPDLEEYCRVYGTFRRVYPKKGEE